MAERFVAWLGARGREFTEASYADVLAYVTQLRDGRDGSGGGGGSEGGRARSPWSRLGGAAATRRS